MDRINLEGMKGYITFLLLLIMTGNLVSGQAIIKNKNQIKGMENMPQESVFVHFNSSFLLAGEYLYYKVYCLNTKTTRLSDFSKIAYVELVGKEKKPIFKQKIILRNGMGNGDFFIPVTVPSGNYKIIAYTNWMRNRTENIFFQNDISIINPYQKHQLPVQDKKFNHIESIGIKAKIDKALVETNINKIQTNKTLLNLTLEVEKYTKRSKVSINLKGSDLNDIPTGNYSVSVRKKSGIPEPIKLATLNFVEKPKLNEAGYTHYNGSNIFLPELRGELLSGRVIALNDSVAIKNIPVAFSIPGDYYFFEIAHTNELGEFYINIDNYYSGDKAVVEVLGNNRQTYNVELNAHSTLDYSNLKFKNFNLFPSMRDEILQRSIHNQIESAYFEFKPDSIAPEIPVQLFDNKKVLNYNLDDFTRFTTVRETILEIIKNVYINKIDKEIAIIKIQGYNFDTNTGILPLVFVDGIVIQNHSLILDYDARNIEEISVIRDQFVFGSETFQGVIQFKTKNGFYDQLQNETNVLVTTIFKPQTNKNYYTQRYDEPIYKEIRTHIPDDRLQLLWFPNLNLIEMETTITFFTSDVAGTFQINIEGFSKTGIPVSMQHSFYVE
ncbi:MAG: hypothetical protein COB01_11510 [Lutibacter sp.]|nr:MAG: hypothetical protein COB01_11510 [Lutibacter sp.]